MKRLVLVDGNSLIHRAYHALPPLNAPDGTQVNAVYGFTTMLLRVMQELKPEYIAVTFDRPEPTFRHSQYVGYKANRPKADNDLIPQFQLIRDMVVAFNMPIFELAGFEADDLVGTLARQANELNDQPEFKKDKLEVIIVSGDMDTLQLVNEHTKVFTPRKGISDTMLYDIAQVRERFGFDPKQLIDYKGLRGDPSDNIPGVPGIGEKTGMQLIQQYGSVEGVYENIVFLKGKVRENIAENAEQAKLSKSLATIDTNAPITLHLEATKAHEFDRNLVLKAFQRFGFRSLVTRLNEVFPIQGKITDEVVGEMVESSEEAVRGDYKIVQELKEVEQLAQQLRQAGTCAFDTETTTLKAIDASLVGLSFAYRVGEAFYVPYTPERLKILKPILEDETIKKIGHNMKYDVQVLENHGVNVSGLYFDTLLASWLVNPSNITVSLGLKSVAYQELGIQMQEITELIGKGKNQITMDQVPMEKVANYACADADIAYRLKAPVEKKLKGANLWHVFERYEMPLVNVLKRMERHGITVDCDFLSAMSKELESQIAECQKEVYASVGHEFNLNSPKQLADVLFNELHLPTSTKNKTGFSTDESVLNSLKDAHPAIAYLLKNRELTKLKNTYIDALPTMVNATTGRVHTTYNQTGTASGRISSIDPNLQNIPIKTEIGAKVRQAFVASPGHVLVSADYSQIELRILAHLSQDPILVKAFKEQQDVHTITAAIIYGVKESEVTKDMRRVGKTINFALMYGVSAFGLSQQLGLERSQAQAFIERYFVTYSRVKEFFDDLLEKAKDDGYVETISGRKRYIPELHSQTIMIKRAGERMALNLPMQGANADIIKLAMIHIDDYLIKQKSKTKMLLQVHDELVFEVPQEDLSIILKQIKDFMTHAVTLSVPIVVELKSGKSWGTMTPLTD